MCVAVCVCVLRMKFHHRKYGLNDLVHEAGCVFSQQLRFEAFVYTLHLVCVCLCEPHPNAVSSLSPSEEAVQPPETAARPHLRGDERSEARRQKSGQIPPGRSGGCGHVHIHPSTQGEPI